jgi:membrane protein
MSPVIDGAEERPSGSASAIAHRLIAAIKTDDVSGLSAEIAYRFLFAIFPFGLFVAALGAFVATSLHIANPAEEIVGGLGDNLPPAIADALRPELERLLTTARADLLAIGAIAALWAATGGTNALVKGIHRAYDVPEQRPFLLRYAVAVGLTLLAALGLIASFVTIVGGAMITQQLAAQFGLGDQAFALLQLARWPAVFLVLAIAVAILYRYAPSVVVPWRWIAVGAAAFTVGWIVATAGLGFYAANIANYGATYGSLGAVIVLMLWFYVTAAMLIIGAELTAALTRELSPSEVRRRGEELEAADAIEGAANGATRRVKDVAGRPAG